jgi:hypothetical protein
VAGGNKQRDYISKEDASSPTVATEAVLLSCIINAEEGRDVAVIDIPNAFIQMRMEDEGDMAIIKIRGVLVEILVQIAPDVCKSYVTSEKKGTKQLLAGTVPEGGGGDNGCKPTVLSQIHQESDECWI